MTVQLRGHVRAAPEQVLLDWLTSDAVVEPDGVVMSWWNPTHRGYPYPEIAGYLLSLLSFEGDSTLALRNRVARRLVADISPAGGVGRGGADYVFDSSMALAGLLAHEGAGGAITDSAAFDRLFGYISRTLGERRGFTGPAEGDPGHWSRSYGAHLLKVSIALGGYDAREGSSGADPILTQLYEELTPLYDDGRFRVNEASRATYLHSHCYAIEGLLAMNGDQQHRRELIEGGAAWLATIQDPTGGIREWHDGRHAYGALHSDATAQAVRIWSAVDRARFTPSIERGLGFLRTMLVPGAGLRYEPGSDDVNTWASIFALQAFRWADEGGTWQWIA